MDYKKNQENVFLKKNAYKRQRNFLQISLLASEDDSEKTPDSSRRKTLSKYNHEEEARFCTLCSLNIN